MKVPNERSLQESFGNTINDIQQVGKGTLLIETETKQKISIDVLVVPKIATVKES